MGWERAVGRVHGAARGERRGEGARAARAEGGNACARDDDDAPISRGERYVTPRSASAALFLSTPNLSCSASMFSAAAAFDMPSDAADAADASAENHDIWGGKPS